nr:hypothetical protein [Tanacetum cinerariifolium]
MMSLPYILVMAKYDVLSAEAEIDLLGLYKLVDDLGGYMNVEFNNHWSDVANMLGLTLEDKEAIKECYKEFIGMVKVYYEEAKRLKQGRLGLVVELKAPQEFATTIAEVEEAPNATQARIAKENVKTNCSKEEGIASDETAKAVKDTSQQDQQEHFNMIFTTAILAGWLPTSRSEYPKNVTLDLIMLLVGNLRELSNKSNNVELKLFLEVEVGQDLQPISPPAKTKEEILFLFKLYDPVKEELRWRFACSETKTPPTNAFLNMQLGFMLRKSFFLWNTCTCLSYRLSNRLILDLFDIFGGFVLKVFQSLIGILLDRLMEMIIDFWWLELFASAIYAKTASSGIWNDLKETYDKVDGSVVYNLHKNINSLNQNGSPLADYHNNLNSLWKQFHAMFLMGLVESYLAIRSNLLTRELLPSVKTAFSIISGEESNRNVTSVGTTKPVATAFAAKTFDNKKKFNNNYKGSGSNSNSNSNNNNRGTDLNLKSTNCNKFDHTVDRCFELIGYPAGYVKRNFNSNSKRVTSNNASTDVHSNGLTVYPNGTQALITKIEDLKINNEVTLYDVLVIPEYIVSLLSVHKLARDSKFFVGFDETNCYIQDLEANRNVWIGKQYNGLYLLDVDNTYFKLSLMIKKSFIRPLVFIHLNKMELQKENIGIFLMIPSSVMANKSPYSYVYGHDPSLSHLRGNDDYGATSMDETNNTHPEGTVFDETDFLNDFYVNSEFNSETEDLPIHTLRRSSRQTKLPSSLNDFIVEGKVKYGVERVVNYANLNHDNYCFASALNMSVEPTCYKEAILDNVNSAFLYRDLDEDIYMTIPKGLPIKTTKTSKQVNLDAESDVESVSETYFGEHDENLGNDQDPIQPLNEKETSNDPFNIYDLLKKHDKGEVNSGLDTSFPYSPGFTPEKDNLNIDVHEVKDMNKKGGSILEVLDDMIKSVPCGVTLHLLLLVGMVIVWSWVTLTKSDTWKIVWGRFLTCKGLMSSITSSRTRVNDEILLSRMDLLKQIQDIKSSDARDCMQKAKIQWAIKGDENSKFFHGIINRKRANLAIKGVMVDGEWMDDPSRVAELENPITRDEIRNAVWACGKNKSPGQTDLLLNFSVSFGILLDQTCASRLNGSLIIARSQRAVIHLSLLEFRKPMILSLWDYLDDVLRSFGFGSKWCSWISGSLISRMAILINGSPTSEFQFHYGLKQGDPLAPYLFILIMESLYLSFSRAVDAGIFTGIKIDSSLTISHLFYADDVVFIGSGTFSTEFKVTKGRLRGSNVLSVGNGMRTQFWNDTWVGDTQLRYMFSCIYALEVNKICTVADKLQGSVAQSLRRTVRGGVDAHQLDLLQNLIGPTILTNLEDRWVWDLNGKRVFRVKIFAIFSTSLFSQKTLLL